MRCAGQFAVILALILCQLCCKRSDSFEAVFEEPAKELPGSGLIKTPVLSGRATGKIVDCSIYFYTGQSDRDAEQGIKFGEMRLSASEGEKWVAAWDLIITDHVSSNGLHLTERDLRMGQRIRVSYELARKPRSVANVEVLNYSRPSKVLRLSISTVIEGELKGKLSADSVESVVIAALSWRLPSDVAIAKVTEKAEGMTPIGELKVTYKLIGSRTEWLLRAYELYESLDLETKLMDADASTNWDRLSFTGGFSPGGSSDVNDMTTKDVLTKVPSFEIHAKELKKK